MNRVVLKPLTIVSYFFAILSSFDSEVLMVTIWAHIFGIDVSDSKNGYFYHCVIPLFSENNLFCEDKFFSN